MVIKRNINMLTQLTEETTSYLPRFKDHCYKTCPEKTYREEFECKACDTNCGNCDQNECYWCEEGFFLLGKPENSCSVASNSLRPYGWQPAMLLCPWNSPGKNTGVGCHSLLQGIFPTQESNPGLPHCEQTLYRLSPGQYSKSSTESASLWFALILQHME